MLGLWPCPGGDEYAVSFDQTRSTRVLVLSALFEEANKLRHFTLEVMRLLDQGNLDTFLPDLRGCNESLAPLAEQDLGLWREQVRAAAEHFGATHILTIRAGALLDPGHLHGIRYAPLEGAALLKTMLRSRVLADREMGVESDRETLLEKGKCEGLALAGYALGAEMLRQLEVAIAPESEATMLSQSALGGSGLWLRPEPSHDADQASKLAACFLEALT